MNTGTPLKLFADAHVFDGEYQGTRTFIRELYTKLAENDQLQIYLGAYDIENLAKHFSGCNNIIYVQYRSSKSVMRLLYDIPRIIKKHGIDYAHFQYICPIWKNCKFIVTTHDVLFNEFPQEFSTWYRYKKNFLYKWSARYAEILTTDSDHSAKAIQQYLKINPVNIHKVAPGIAPHFFEPYDPLLAKDAIRKKYGLNDYILMVSRLEPRKNQLLVLRSWLDFELYKQGISLVILGHQSLPIPLFDSLLKTVPQEARSYLFINGQIDDADLLNFYRAARVFVYPSKAEGFGLPPLEAGAAGIPVICSNQTAMEEYSFFGENHLNPADYNLFTKRLLQLIELGCLDEKLEQISATIHKRYSWEKNAAAFYQLIASHHHKQINNDQFSIPRPEQGGFAATVPAGQAISAPGDR